MVAEAAPPIKSLDASVAGATAAVTATAEEGEESGSSHGKNLSSSPPPGTRKAPYPPPAHTPSAVLGNLGSARGRGPGGDNCGGGIGAGVDGDFGGRDMNKHGLRENRNVPLGIFSSNGSNAGHGENLPGIFSDDESEAGHSTDQESYGVDGCDGGGGGGGRYSGYGRYDGYDETVGEETKRNVVRTKYAIIGDRSVWALEGFF